MLEMIASAAQKKFGQHKQDSLTAQCRRCTVRNLCHGGCPKDRFSLSRDGEPGQNYLCAGLELFFLHTKPAMQIMARLLQQNRAPSEIMAIIAAQDEKSSHDLPNPCGLRESFKPPHTKPSTDLRL